MRNLFGWNYPPGAALDPNAPYNQKDPPCEVCGNHPDDCICPTCPTCGVQGDPRCYGTHGLILSDEQVASLRRREDEQEEQVRAEAEYYHTDPSDAELFGKK